MFCFNIDPECLPFPVIPKQYIFCWKFNCRNPIQKPQAIYLNILISFRRNAMIDHLSFWDWVNYLEDSNLLLLCNWWDIHMSSDCTRALGCKLSLKEWDAKKIIEGGSAFTSKVSLQGLTCSQSEPPPVMAGMPATPIPPSLHTESCLPALILS